MCNFFFNRSLANVRSREKIGVLYSYKNVEAYNKNNIIGFDQAWKSFLYTFEETYLNYQFLCNISPETKIDALGVKVIFYPLAVDISSEEITFLKKFIAGGGKLIISAGIGSVSQELKQFFLDNQFKITDNVIAKQTLTLNQKVDDLFFELPYGNYYSVFDLDGTSKKILAHWKENDEIAIGGNKNLCYLGYSWGQDINRGNDIKIFLRTLDILWDNISTRLIKEVTEAEYKKILKDITVIETEASSVIQVSEQLDLPVPEYQLKKHFEKGVSYLNDFNTDFLFGNHLKARDHAKAAKSEFAIVYSLGIPSRNVEVRAIWLDRGTIVSMKTPVQLTNLIKNLAKVGFNVIFFETVNAGYPIYPSMLLPQNPLVKNWDPLKVAIEAAHSSGVDLHAWVWVFAVGNTRHNVLIGKPVEYSGPILETKGIAWALTDKNGALRIDLQPEFWISPANKKACEFLIELYSEIVKNYDVDGIQFDYIRFPFQKPESQVGFDIVTKEAFKKSSGKLPALEGAVNKIWKEWKVNQVSNFVQDASLKLKKIKPALKVSVAVFGIDRSLRLRQIQQDWESWLLNRWIDAAYPFYYSDTAEELKEKLSRETQSINQRGVIIPGFNLRMLTIGEFAERMTASRNSGVLGVCLFAAEHLDSAKRDLLVEGPYREQAPFVPYNQPLLASQKILDEFSSIVDKFAVTKKLSILTNSQTQKEVYFLTQELKEDFKNYKPEKADEIEQKLVSLQLKVKDWLSLEKYLDRQQRAFYISTYLDQVRTLLNYIKGK